MKELEETLDLKNQLEECRALNRELKSSLSVAEFKLKYQIRRSDSAEARVFELREELDMAIGNLQAIHALSYPVSSVVRIKEVNARANQTDLDVSPEISSTGDKLIFPQGSSEPRETTGITKKLYTGRLFDHGGETVWDYEKGPNTAIAVLEPDPNTVIPVLKGVWNKKACS